MNLFIRLRRWWNLTCVCFVQTWIIKKLYPSGHLPILPFSSSPPPPPPSFSKTGGYDHGSKLLSVLSTCNVGSCVRSLATFTKKCIYDGKKELKHFFWKNDYSFQQLEKKVHASLGFFVTIIDNEKFVVLSTFPVVINHQETYLLIGSQSFVITAVIYACFKGWWYYLLRLPISHCVPLNPGTQLQLNPFTWSVQVPLFLQGWPAQSSISVLRR